jgi:PAS domain S-box-containing protein
MSGSPAAPGAVLGPVVGLRTVPLAWRALLVGLCYYGCAHLGSLLSLRDSAYVTFWLPSGVFIAALLLEQTRAWPWLALAVLPANVGFDLPRGTGLGLTLLFFGANTVAAVGGAALIRRFVSPRPTLATLRELIGLVGFGAVIATMLGATIGAAGLTAAGLSRSFGETWRIWWGSTGMAVLLVSPFILTWTARAEAPVQHRAGRGLEALVLVAALTVVAWHVVRGSGLDSPRAVWLLPILLWAGLRFGTRGATAASLWLALTMALLNTQLFAGPALDPSLSRHQVFTLQTFLAVSALVALIPAIVLAERDGHLVALRASEERFRTLNSAAFEGIAISENGRILDVNEQALRMFGYERADLIGRPVLDVIAPISRAAVAAAIAGNHEAIYEHVLLRRDGSTFFAEARAKVAVVGDRRLRMTALRDITERKQAEAALRTSEQQAAALEAARLKSEFVANMSHEIRTPLNAVVGLTHLVLRTSLDTQQREYLERIQSSGKALLEVINKVLDFSKIEAGRLVLDRAAFRLVDVIGHVANLLSMPAEEKGVALRFSVADAVPATLIGDETRLGQVLVNLVGNAVKFTERGAVTVTVQSGARDAASVELCFRIADTGIGMSDEQVGRLFAPFTQADGSTNRRYGGTGLGLVISQRIVEQMGGVLVVESAPWVGTTFTLTARFGVGDSPALTGAAAPDLPALAAGADNVLAGARVLLVEDVMINQVVARELLEGAGAEVQIASDGLEATRVFAAAGATFDLILMDVQMPVMDGYEATRIIRADARGAVIPIIAMTAHAFESERKKCLDAGMNDHVPKPVDPDVLIAVVSRWRAHSAART